MSEEELMPGWLCVVVECHGCLVGSGEVEAMLPVRAKSNECELERNHLPEEQTCIEDILRVLIPSDPIEATFFLYSYRRSYTNTCLATRIRVQRCLSTVLPRHDCYPGIHYITLRHPLVITYNIL